MSKLNEQIAEEARELFNAPKVEIRAGRKERCHLCGRIFDVEQGTRFDTHIRGANGRLACPYHNV